MLKRYGIGWKVGSVCVRVWVFNMEELNELTKWLFQEGYDKEHYPDYVKPFNKYYGGFEYTLEAQRKLVFKTPCGLLVKGSHWNSGYMSFMGVDWCLENGNPTLNCPYKNPSCKKRHELLQGKTTNGRCMIVFCDCALTDESYDYEHSIDKVQDTIADKQGRLHEAFKKQHRHCTVQDCWHDEKAQWEFRYDPFVCATNHCEYCTALRQDMYPNVRGNVFYDLKITIEGGGEGLLKRDFDVEIIKGKRLFEKNISLSLAEIIAKSFQHEIQRKEEMQHHRELFFSEHHGRYFKCEVLNVRAEKRVSRDLEQDLKDIADGIAVTHESDLLASQKEVKHQRRIEAEQKKVKQLLNIVFEKGMENLTPMEQNRIKKFQRKGILTKYDIAETDENGKEQKQIQQIRFEGFGL